jgi:two-component system response regulator RegA
MRPEEGSSILLVDDDATFRERLAKALASRGYDVRQAGDAIEAVRLAEAESPELALVDLRMPGASGLEVVRDLVKIDPSTNVVVLTGYGSIATALEAVRLGATHYLSKPADVDEILAAFERKDAPKDDVLAPPESVPSLARAEWEHIQRVLTDCAGNVSHAARLLGVHRRSLQRKLSKYPVKR